MFKKYPYELLPGHMVSPARYSFQRNIYRYFQQNAHVRGQDKKILDFGCGSAVFRFYFRDKLYFGFDIADRGFALKRGEGVNLLVSDAQKVPFRNSSFDFVFCNAVFEHVDDDLLAAKEAFRVLKEGSYCYTIVPSSLSPIYDEVPFRLIGYKGHGEHYYSREKIIGLLTQAGFEIVTVDASMGFFCSILKVFYVYQRGIRSIFGLILSRVFKIKYTLRGETHAWDAVDFCDLQRITGLEYKQGKILKYLYRKLLEICFFLDRALPFSKFLACEWFVIARKPMVN